ncbi:MAG TPA: hypothetical protein VFT29_12185 [Gemmatimonadaceae bacterium]|nr:hypothetical protein [Gemmatimonadaceae bacterium]
MKRQFYAVILAAIAMLVIDTAGALAQSEPRHGAPKPMPPGMPSADMSRMMNEPHAALAMAFGQTVGTFARTLHDQAERGSPLDVSFARTAVAEIRRSYNSMEQQHAEHMKTMSDEMRSRMAAMMKEMETHQAMVREAVVALENDVRTDQLDAKQITRDSGNLLQHLAQMSAMHHERMGTPK